MPSLSALMASFCPRPRASPVGAVRLIILRPPAALGLGCGFAGGALGQRTLLDRPSDRGIPAARIDDSSGVREVFVDAAGRRCPVCGESLEGRRSGARYCSGSCRARASIARRLADGVPVAGYASLTAWESRRRRTTGAENRKTAPGRAARLYNDARPIKWGGVAPTTRPVAPKGSSSMRSQRIHANSRTIAPPTRGRVALPPFGADHQSQEAPCLTFCRSPLS
jgi:hypothetical protein